MMCRLLAGTSGIKKITKFDVTGYPTDFAGEISDFDSEGYVLAKVPFEGISQVVSHNSDRSSGFSVCFAS